MTVSGAGHVPCKDNDGNDLPNMTFYTEVDLGPATGTPTAALRGSCIQVSITFWRPAYAPGWFVGTFYMNPLMRNGQPIPMTPMSFYAAIPPGGTWTRTFTVGPLPDHVSWRHSLCFSWTADWYSSGYFWQPLYLIQAPPTFPQARPWLGVLDNACTWAEGENTGADVAREMALGLYFAQRFFYSGLPELDAEWWDDELGAFMLSEYLDTPGWVRGNCVDVSNYLLICANAVGLSFTVSQYTDYYSYGDFTTHPACPIGSDPDPPPLYDPGPPPTWVHDWTYTPFRWGMHQFVVWTGGTVYDACAAHKEDLSGNGYRNPPFGWPLSGYWQTDFGARTLGLVAVPRPAAPLLTRDPYVPGVI